MFKKTSKLSSQKGIINKLFNKTRQRITSEIITPYNLWKILKHVSLFEKERQASTPVMVKCQYTNNKVASYFK